MNRANSTEYPAITVGDVREFVDAGTRPTAADDLIYVVDDEGRRREVVKLTRTFPGARDVVMAMRPVTKPAR